jgi:hypothetical protein
MKCEALIAVGAACTPLGPGIGQCQGEAQCDKTAMVCQLCQ